MSEANKTRTIPLHIADQAVAACEAEIQKLKEENARLKAEVERLEKTEEYLQNTLNQYALDDMRLTAELARLKAEVERLNRHGDLMLKFAAANMAYPAYATIAKDWNAAKEGKPRV